MSIQSDSCLLVIPSSLYINTSLWSYSERGSKGSAKTSGTRMMQDGRSSDGPRPAPHSCPSHPSTLALENTAERSSQLLAAFHPSSSAFQLSGDKSTFTTDTGDPDSDMSFEVLWMRISEDEEQNGLSKPGDPAPALSISNRVQRVRKSQRRQGPRTNGFNKQTGEGMLTSACGIRTSETKPPVPGGSGKGRRFHSRARPAASF